MPCTICTASSLSISLAHFYCVCTFARFLLCEIVLQFLHLPGPSNERENFPCSRQGFVTQNKTSLIGEDLEPIDRPIRRNCCSSRSARSLLWDSETATCVKAIKNNGMGRERSAAAECTAREWVPIKQPRLALCHQDRLCRGAWQRTGHRITSAIHCCCARRLIHIMFR